MTDTARPPVKARFSGFGAERDRHRHRRLRLSGIDAREASAERESRSHRHRQQMQINLGHDIHLRSVDYKKNGDNKDNEGTI